MSEKQKTAWVAVFALSLTFALLPAVRARAATLPGWEILQSPTNARFAGAAVSSADDAWMVGSTAPIGVPQRAIAYHWNGGSWGEVEAASLGDFSSFGGVDAIGDDVIAVGGLDGYPKARHFDGTGWTTEEFPAVGDNYPGVHDVAMLSATSAVAVGSVGVVIGGGFDNIPAVLTWDGDAWTGSAPFPTTRAVLTAVEARTASDVWASGYTMGLYPFMTHFNGTSWTQVALPDVGIGQIDGIAAFGASSAIAVGWQGVVGGPRRTLALRWNGTSWIEESTPNLGGLDNELSDVDGTTLTDVWAVGSERLDDHYRQTLAVHRTAGGWSVSPTPNEPEPSAAGNLSAVAVTSSTEAFAGGRSILGYGASLAHDSALDIEALPANWGQPVPVRGTLSFSRGSFAEGREVTISRAAQGETPVEVGTAVTGYGGYFEFLDDPGAQGEYTYTVTFDGDATWAGSSDSDVGQLYGESIEVGLRVKPSRITVGEKVTLKAHLGPHLDNDVLEIYAKRPGKPETLVTQGSVDANGNLSVTVRPSFNTGYRAWFAGDTQYAPSGSGSVDVEVEPVLTATAVKRDGVDGNYALYRYDRRCTRPSHVGCPTFVARLEPRYPRGIVNAFMQVFAQGSWHTFSEFSGRLDAKSRFIAVVFYRDRRIVGYRYRIRFNFHSDKNLRETSSPLVYFRVI